jgi:hypothetical protein
VEHLFRDVPSRSFSTSYTYLQTGVHTDSVQNFRLAMFVVLGLVILAALSIAEKLLVGDGEDQRD